MTTPRTTGLGCGSCSSSRVPRGTGFRPGTRRGTERSFANPTLQMWIAGVVGRFHPGNNQPRLSAVAPWGLVRMARMWHDWAYPKSKYTALC